MPFGMGFLLPCGRGGKGLPFEMRFLRPCGRGGKGLPFERGNVCPAGTEACFLFVILAACAAGGKAGPVMGLRPFSAPLASPPKHPLQVFNYLGSARAARLVLRELPSLQSGDLPARRAIPSFACSLGESSGPSACLREALRSNSLFPDHHEMSPPLTAKATNL